MQKNYLFWNTLIYHGIRFLFTSKLFLNVLLIKYFRTNWSMKPLSITLWFSEPKNILLQCGIEKYSFSLHQAYGKITLKCFCHIENLLKIWWTEENHNIPTRTSLDYMHTVVKEYNKDFCCFIFVVSDYS